jgi:hypothetical protein
MELQQTWRAGTVGKSLKLDLDLAVAWGAACCVAEIQSVASLMVVRPWIPGLLHDRKNSNAMRLCPAQVSRGTL